MSAKDEFDIDTSGFLFRRQCNICAAIVGDREAHLAWHQRIRDAIENGLPTIPVDEITQ